MTSRRVSIPGFPGRYEVVRQPSTRRPLVTTIAPHTDQPPTPARPSSPRPILPPVAGEKVVVNQGASGVGDGLLALCAAIGLRQDLAQPIQLQVSSTALPFVRLFSGLDAVELHQADTSTGQYLDVPLGAPGDERQVNQGYATEVRERCPIPRWERYCRNIGATRCVLPQVLDRDYLLQLGAEHAGVIALAPGTAWDTRSWPYQHWRSLERELLRAGHRVVILDTDRERCRGYDSLLLINASAEVVAGVLLHAACLVSNDSGLAHLAGVLGRPTVVLGSVTTPASIYGLYPAVIWPRGTLGCSGCWWQQPYEERHCSPRCPDLATITPQRVTAAIAAATRLAALDVAEPLGVSGVRADRRATMTAFVRHILSKPVPLMVETGCQRSAPDPGAGESTTLLGHVAAGAGGRLVSVDNDQIHVSFAAHQVRHLPAYVVQADATDWLLGYKGPAIDGLYLDSADTWTRGFEGVCLDEAQAAVEHVASDGVILIDDTVHADGCWQGKGAQALPWLVANGWEVAAVGYQVLLRRRPGV